MYKLTIEKIDPQTQIEGKLVYLTEPEAAILVAAGIKVEYREEGRSFSDRDIKDRPKQARIPIPDFRRVVETKVYEQVLEDLDIAKIIKAANGIQ